MTSKDLREKFLDFFAKKGHKIIPSAPLIPEHDPTVLFTTAGMHPLTPFLLGEKHPAGKRLVDVQKCVRTGDIDDVGDAWHLTFFEMLGNWSLGDYWKKEAIEWSFEFLTEKKHLKIPEEKLNVTVFAGDKDAPRDEESAKIWLSLGVPKDRIFYLPKEDNWWGPAGKTGPCGPCTEMFYDTGKKKCRPDCQPGCKCDKYAEIWNDVFMEYNKTIEGKYESLAQKNVDTGMGIERTTAVLNGFDNVYETELFRSIIKKIEELSGKKYEEENIRTMRIIADHIKAASFILAEEVEPSNVEQGYVLRRLIRRAVRYGKRVGINEIFTFKIADATIEMYRDAYPELLKNRDFIEEQLVKEEERFSRTLERGLRELDKEIQKMNQVGIKSLHGDLGEIAFYFFETFGFPLELFLEEIKTKFLHSPDDIKKSFYRAFQKHQEISRAGAEQKFSGGLADHSEKVVKYHTATHLLLAALREILGPEIYQKGSNITAERLRFDFNYPEKLSEGQIKKIENLVNEKIKQDIEVEMMELPKEEALKIAKVSFDPSKYGDIVKVYKIDDFSIELCGGPHVKRTSELGQFEIVKEESSGAGVRRIRAILK
jgi:alanyl-tRNA synthetase